MAQGREVKVAFLGDVSSLKRATAEAEKSMGSFDGQADKVARSAGKSFGGISKSVAIMGAAVVGSMGAALASVKKLATAATDYGVSVGKVQRATGVTAEQASLFAYAAQQTGTDVDGLGKGIKKLSTDMFNGGDTLAKLGIAARDQSGNLRPFWDVIGDISDQFAVLEDGPEKTALAVQLFGRTGDAMIPMLNNGRQGLAAYKDEMDKFGLALDDSGIAKAREAKGAQRDLSAAWDGLVVQLGFVVLPALNAVSTWFANWWKDNGPAFKAGIEEAKRIFGEWRDSGDEARKEWDAGFDRIENKLIGMWNGWKDTSANVFNEVGSLWRGFNETVANAWNFLSDTWGNFGTWITDHVIGGINMLIDAFKTVLDLFEKVSPFGGAIGEMGKALHLPGFDEGGIVPGAIGKATLAIVHGGETVLPTHKNPGMAGGMNITHNVTGLTGEQAAQFVAARERQAMIAAGY